MNNDICPICGNDNTYKEFPSDDFFSAFFICPACGRFKVDFDLNSNILDYLDKNKLASYLYYNNEKSKSFKNPNSKLFFNFIGSDKNFEKVKKESPYSFHVTKEIVENWYPHSFNEKINMFLLNLYNRQNYFEDKVTFTEEQLKSACFVTRYLDWGKELNRNQVSEQANSFVGYLSEQGFVSLAPLNEYIILKPDGLKRVDEFQKSDINNKNVFVSMAFNDKTKDTRKAIKEGIISSGYSPEFIDEIIHNKQIVPEMFRLIRESRFLILEISEPNYGAYYEAGYALGLGKEVIICCNEDVFNNNIPKFNKDISEEEFKKFQKYFKPHFDIAQKQILVWKDYDELTSTLAEWIKAII